MYSNKKNVLQLVSLLKAHEIQQIVISPGSRNSPIVHSLTSDSDFICHSVVDERSAGFYALGISLYSGMPVAVCCTSGSAVLNYGPSVAEAFYQKVPLVYITADRPASRIGQGENQTIPQPGIFGDLVKKSVQLPEVNTFEDEWYCNRLINEALLGMYHLECGPVHINVPLSEPLYEYTVEKLPHVREIHHCIPWDPSSLIDQATFFNTYALELHKYNKVMLIVGQSFAIDSAQFIEKFVDRFDCVVLTEHLSYMDPKFFIRNFDALINSLPLEKWEDYAPDLLITMGGHIVSKRIGQLLCKFPPKSHWHFSPSGEIRDTYQCLKEVIQCNGLTFFDYLSNIKLKRKKTFHKLWESTSIRLPEPSPEYSDLMAVGKLINALPKKCTLHLANSSSVRLGELFSLKNHIRVFANRGTSGIDGCLSTAIGQASVTDNLTFVVIGDLAFFYDMNILWNRRLPKGLRILLNNNGGGEIFYTLPGFEKSEASEEFIVAANSTSAKAWAETMGLTYLSVTNEEELKQNMPVFVEAGGVFSKPILMEVFTSAEKNVEILENYYQSIKL
ncbi:2-succinyl-5-enolpyruvyl-6-hydroxy-3-cyclohexene-1-carboxylate synthase [Bacteroidia bacterium]|nr:2-succinyl-5-enolpyruvyl-6-hydroxy-3-cyclohexene-1-carboxylate synthase [Bacteroidia bacterium]